MRLIVGVCALVLLGAGGCAEGGGGTGAMDAGGGGADAGEDREDAGSDAGASECTRNEDCPDDGVFCNGVVSCQSGRCVASPAPTCNDGVGCTMDECVLATDECQNTPVDSLCPDGTVCVAGAGCQTPAACEFDDDCGGDGVFCNGDEVCVDGACASPGSRDCDDGDSCTLDECAESMGACASTVYEDVLTNPMHCGTGDDDCVVCPGPDAGAEHVVPVCVAGGCDLACEEGFLDEDDDLANGCEIECAPGGAEDEPDDAFEDANCDGIDGDRDRAIFVSASRGSNANDGLTSGTAVATVARAIAIQAGMPTRDQILIESGSYDMPAALELASGTGLYGGYGADFATRTDSRATLTASSPTALIIDGATSPIVVDHVNLATENRSGVGESTQTVRIRDGFDRVRFRHVTIVAGRGGPGAPGTSGGPGDPGTPGAPGDGSAGGAGGLFGGGRGADGVRRDPGPAGMAGDANDSACGGPAGSGSGSGGLGCADGDPNDGGTPASGGCPGPSGSDGSPGAVAGLLDFDGGYTPARGGLGGQGGTGGGGGGGGAGGGEDCTVAGVCTFCGTGGGGGGGGGGEGGDGGTGGGGGGASIGIVLATTTLSMEDVRIQTAGGGNGGRGGNGGDGGMGGPGGAGTTRSSSTEGDGGNGGSGGPGGDGGCGGGGGGGPSVGVWGFGISSRLDEVDPVVFLVGSGGNGGPSCGNAGMSGESTELLDAFSF